MGSRNERLCNGFQIALDRLKVTPHRQARHLPTLDANPSVYETTTRSQRDEIVFIADYQNTLNSTKKLIPIVTSGHRHRTTVNAA